MRVGLATDHGGHAYGRNVHPAPCSSSAFPSSFFASFHRRNSSSFPIRIVNC